MKILWLLIFLLIPVRCLAGYDKPGSTSAQFLKIGISARAVGMGESFVAISNDASAIFYNPAGLVTIGDWDALLTHIEYPADINYDFGGLAHRLTPNIALGVSFSNLYTDEIKVRTPLHPEGTGETFYSSDYTAALSYAQYLTDRFSFGLNFRYIGLNPMTGSFKKSTWAIDLGTLYQTGFKNFNIGIAIQSFGPNVQFINESYAIPTNFTVGIAADLLTTGPHNLTLASSWAKPAATEETANIGVEYTLNKIFTLRGGYKINYDAETWSLGAGVTLPLGGSILRVDYAYSDFGYLTNTQRFSLGIGF